MAKFMSLSIYIKVALIAVVLLAAIFAMPFIFLHGRLGNIAIENIDLKGKKYSEALAIVKNHSENILRNNKLIFTSSDGSWEYNLEDISFSFNWQKSVDNAYSHYYSGNVFKRWFNIATGLFHKKRTEHIREYDEKRLKDILVTIKKQVDKEAKNASIKYNAGAITFTKETEGCMLDIDKNTKLVENYILKDFYTISLDVEKILPDLRYDYIKEIKGKLSEFSTFFSAENENRTYNLDLACKSLDGKVLMPGEIFSMNDVLGPRTEEKGYRQAKIIVNNEYTDGVGGGVCQVTTTLYNTVLLSRLNVIERTNHSILSSYVAPGRDATLAEGNIDFRFSNSRDYPICISAGIANSRVYVRILGRDDGEKLTVRLVPEIIDEYFPQGEDIEIDDTLPDNSKEVVRQPKRGVKVILFREIYNPQGKLINREKISQDTYKPVKPKIKVNRNYLYRAENNVYFKEVE